MGFRNYKQLIAYTSTRIIPDGFPASPRHTYGDEYEGDEAFFGERPRVVLPFEVAIRKVRRLNLKSIKEYHKYVREFESNKPHSRLPIHPIKVWPNEWTCWGDYLGTGRVSNSKRQFLPFNEALAYVHQLKLKGEKEWKEYAKSDKRPSNIPHNPWEVYSEYVGIKSWVGTDVVSKSTTRMNGHQVLCILHDNNDPDNIYSYEVFRGGVTQAIEWSKNTYTIVRTYKHEHDLMDEVHRVIHANSSGFYDQQFTAINFNQIRFELDMMLEIIS
jgi:hypothetical protein